MRSLVLFEAVGGVATLTLNRPERHNALVPELLQALLENLALISAQPAEHLRAAVLQANGRSFSTGGDLKGFADHLDDLGSYAHRLVGLLNQVMLRMIECEIPIIAAVHGLVTGGSLGLALAADIVLVAPEASFIPYYSEVGFSADGGWSVLLPAVIGPKRAAEVLVRNLTIDARQAVDWGLANRLVPGERIREEAHQIAEEIVHKYPGSIRQIKRLMRDNYGDLAAKLEVERARFVQQIRTPETRSSMMAFFEEMARH